jgi:tetratricopeptide (TPR) repeat protein
MRATAVAAFLLISIALAPAAHADDFWAELARATDAEIAEREYDRAMLDGDTNLDLAVAETVVAVKRKKYLDRAITAYELAAAARPDAAEPHFRAAAALHAFYLECNPGESAALCTPGGARPLLRAVPHRVVTDRLLRHWDAFEAKAPKDPRVVDDVLLERAILHTKLATPEHLEAARRDYRKILAWRHTTERDAIVLGNLAETEMMLGNLDQAIIVYHRTLELDQSISHNFGLAVALDRDEQGQQARGILRSYGVEGVVALQKQILRGNVFYVPEGEAYYYLALGCESVGLSDDAIRFYDLFLASGAHPQFAPRARANRAAVASRHRGARPVLPAPERERAEKLFVRP